MGANSVYPVGVAGIRKELQRSDGVRHLDEQFILDDSAAGSDAPCVRDRSEITWTASRPCRGILRDQLAPIVRLSPAGERELVAMRWGFPAPPGIGARPIANIRNAHNSSWRPWLNKEFRCLVPATSFCYYGDQPKLPHWFAIDQTRPLFAFAGIWRPWTGRRRNQTKEHLLLASSRPRRTMS